MCFDGAVGAARGLHGQQRLVLSLSLSPVKTNINGFVLLIVDIVARSRQNKMLLSVMTTMLLLSIT